MLEYNLIINAIIVSITVVVVADGPRVLGGIYKVYAGKITLRRAIVDGLKTRGIATALIIVSTAAIYYFVVVFPPTEIEAIVLTIVLIMVILLAGVHEYTVRETPLKVFIYKVHAGKITLKKAIADGIFTIGLFVGMVFAMYHLAVLFYPFIYIGVVITLIMVFLCLGVYYHIVDKLPLKEAIGGGLVAGLLTGLFVSFIVEISILIRNMIGIL